VKGRLATDAAAKKYATRTRYDRPYVGKPKGDPWRVRSREQIKKIKRKTRFLG
jgi:hypothetical protein